MQSSCLVELSQLVERLAGDAVGIQMRWDEAHQHEAERFGYVTAQVSGPLSEVVGQLAPRRLALQQFELDCRVRFAASQEQGVAVSAMPLNAAYSARYGSTSGSESSLCLKVVQVPIAGSCDAGAGKNKP